MSGRMLRIVGTGLLLTAGLATAARAQKADVPLMAGTPSPLPPAADGAQVQFLVGSQSLILRLPPGEVPKVLELRHPARQEVEFAGTSVAPGGAAFATGVVTRYDVVHVGSRSRAILYLRAPLKVRPTIQFMADRVVIAVVPSMAPGPDQVLPSPSPVTYLSPKPHFTPVPTTPPVTGPTPRITPVPVPSLKLPVPREIPPVSAVATEVPA
ncbi:MAG: hypothetical protein JWM80_3260 [Cyanobacteria bacterium RYN_339]|nr:hypothetical protein [Cyanobacteria bacterium RYN_339]